MTDSDTLLAEPADQAPLTNPSGGADMTSPVDLPPFEGEEGNGLVWTSIVIAIATGILLLFNADALRGWAFDLEPGPETERVIAVTDGWYQETERFYLDRPVAVMSGWWEELKALEFGGGDEAAAADSVQSERDAPQSEDQSPDSPGFSPE